MENMHYHPERDIKVGIFVDDPLTAAPGEEQHEWFHGFMGPRPLVLAKEGD